MTTMSTTTEMASRDVSSLLLLFFLLSLPTGLNCKARLCSTKRTLSLIEPFQPIAVVVLSSRKGGRQLACDAFKCSNALSLSTQPFSTLLRPPPSTQIWCFLPFLLSTLCLDWNTQKGEEEEIEKKHVNFHRKVQQRSPIINDISYRPPGMGPGTKKKKKQLLLLLLSVRYIHMRALVSSVTLNWYTLWENENNLVTAACAKWWHRHRNGSLPLFSLVADGPTTSSGVSRGNIDARSRINHRKTRPSISFRNISADAPWSIRKVRNLLIRHCPSSRPMIWWQFHNIVWKQRNRETGLGSGWTVIGDDISASIPPVARIKPVQMGISSSRRNKACKLWIMQ